MSTVANPAIKDRFTPKSFGEGVVRYAVIIALAGVFAFFSFATSTFLTSANLASILVNNFTLLAIIAVAMTFAVSAGGIDLSVGTAVDFASFAFVSLVLSGHSVGLAVIAALASGAIVGLVNALLIAGVGITPFLATLGTLFIGRSAQQLLTNGGNPVYLPQTGIPPLFGFIGHGHILGIPVPLVIVGLLIIAASTLLFSTRFGRVVLAIGVQQSVARYSGLRISGHIGLVYVISGFVAALAGIILTSTVSVYIPNSGNAFMLNAIGATFIGTTLSREGRPNVPGTVLGVLLLSIVANGLLLTGLSFYWQQVGTGLLIFIVLAASFLNRSSRSD
ncbi:ABC transporter permease [Phyllobacterium sophorae]|uniref:Branched-chain amino acid ABC transporter permease n=1 Tax=Phyllobacterium sophorae TaxID=1520277 RepID=A0A2P7BFH9_9HYPH|nr:ABC transporter permease [Phyllobacterium sophorae]PSH65213.1 branched-chain amino acid ABC transporter permease [Phyllobacterium sophorae]